MLARPTCLLDDGDSSIDIDKTLVVMVMTTLKSAAVVMSDLSCYYTDDSHKPRQ
jgi:hypothetical protein